MIRSIDTHMWSDPAFRALSGDGRILWCYLLTCPHSHCGGLYSLPIRYALSDLSPGDGRAWTRARLLAAFAELGDLAAYDADREVVFVARMKSYQGRAPQHAKAMASQCRALRRSPLVRVAIERYPEVTEYLDPEFVEALPVAATCDPAMPASEPARALSPRESETDWRVERTWAAFLAARRDFHVRVDGRAPKTAPTMTAEIRAAIVDALREHDGDRMTAETRDRWTEESPVLAAGEGLWLDLWCTGRDAQNSKRYVEPWRPWKRQRGKGDPVARFAELAFADRRRHEAADPAPRRDRVLLGRLLDARDRGIDVADLIAEYDRIYDTPGLIDQIGAALDARTKEIA